MDPSACAVLVEARSNVGAVSFGSTDVSGIIEAVRTASGVVDVSAQPVAKLAVPLSSLTSGNALYDVELQNRLEVARHPIVVLEMLEAQLLGSADYLVKGAVTMHGVTSTMKGAVTLSFPDSATVLVTGEHVFDIRDFEIDLPSVLMLRIYPDVKVSVHLLARLAHPEEEVR